MSSRTIRRASSFCVLKSESQELFDELCDAFRQEHAPATLTEIILVDRLAEHVWLSQRAQRMQDDAALKGQDSWFALMLRYQTTHDRGFHKCLAELRTVRKERRQHQADELDRQSSEFQSQIAVEARAQAKAKPEGDLSAAEMLDKVKAAVEEFNVNLDAFTDEEWGLSELLKAA